MKKMMQMSGNDSYLVHLLLLTKLNLILYYPHSTHHLSQKHQSRQKQTKDGFAMPTPKLHYDKETIHHIVRTSIHYQQYHKHTKVNTASLYTRQSTAKSSFNTHQHSSVTILDCAAVTTTYAFHQRVMKLKMLILYP